MYPAALFPCAYPAAADNVTASNPGRADGFGCATGVPKQIIRRRPSPHQGRALEKLGHAVEYLVDSRMAMIKEPATRADAKALDTLMRLSRCVFSECEEIVPVGRRLKAWMAGAVSRRTDSGAKA